MEESRISSWRQLSLQTLLTSLWPWPAIVDKGITLFLQLTTVENEISAGKSSEAQTSGGLEFDRLQG